MEDKNKKAKYKAAAAARHGGPGVQPGEKPKNFKLSFKKLVRYMKPSLPLIIIAILFAVAGVIITLEVPNYIGSVVTYVKYGRPLEDIIWLLVKSIIFASISCVLSFIEGVIFAQVSQKISYQMREDIYAKIDKLPLKYYDTTTNGEVLSYLTNDVDTISQTLNQTLSQLAYSVVSLIGVFVMMMKISPLMSLIAVVVIPISLGLIMLIVKFSQKYFVRQQQSLGEVNGHIEEMYAGHNVVSLYNRQKTSKEEFKQFNNKLYASARFSQFLSGMMMPIMNFVGNLGYVFSCVIGGLFAISGKIEVGSIVAFVQYLRQFNQPIAQGANIMSTLQSTMAASERVFGFLDAEDEKETGDAVLESTNGDVEFKNVRFGYSEDKIIINDFSGKVKSGQRAAIVGPTGAGKTTMVKLLMRFYDLNGGSIELDGVDIASYKRSGYRRDFGMVLQDTWLFGGSIRENIRYGRLSATDAEVEAAAVEACCDHFIKTLPGGYDFVINEEADNISQGQKQLLTIARAILADPTVLILDEATSNVDTRTEILIQKAMNRLMTGRTCFVIAHRLSTIRESDLILVMRDGDIVEQGTHNELIAAKGFYEQLYNSQFE